MRAARETRGVVVAATLALSLACGAEAGPAPEADPPTSAEVRDFYGLGAGSCWRYRYTEGSFELGATVSIAGPDTISVEGRTIYKMDVRIDASTTPESWYLDAEGHGTLLLRRSTEGRTEVVQRRYDAEPAPLFGEFVFDEDDEVALAVGAKFETDTTPKLVRGKDLVDGELEHHAWIVLRDDETIATSAGEAKAVYLQYTRDADTARYWLVPGFGFARFTDFSGTTYNECSARVCKSDGSCVGAADCETVRAACP